MTTLLLAARVQGMALRSTLHALFVMSIVDGADSWAADRILELVTDEDIKEVIHESASAFIC